MDTAARSPVMTERARGFYLDPRLVASLSGLEQMRSFEDGRTLPPPVHYLFGLTYVECSPGEARFTMPASAWLSPPAGVLQGAALALLVDAPLGSAVHTTLPPAVPYTTAEMSLSFIRPVAPDGAVLSCTAKVLHAGRTIGLSEGPVIDAAGNTVALASCRCVMLPRLDLPDSLDGGELERHVEPAWPSPHPFERPVNGTVQPQEVFDRLSGLEMSQAFIAGALDPPPIAQLLGMQLTAAGEGTVEWHMPATEWLCSPVQGRLYGGAIAYFAGLATDTAIENVTPARTALAPVDLKVYFLRPVAPGGQQLVARGTVIHRGRSVAIARSEVLDADGRVAAIGMSSAMLLPGRDAALGVLRRH